MGLLGSMVLDWVGPGNSSTHLGILPDRIMVMFNHPNHSGNHSFAHLLTLWQGGHSTAEYSVDFWTFVADTMHRQGFSRVCDQPWDKLTLNYQPHILNTLVSLNISLDNRLRERCWELAAHTSASSFPLSSDTNPVEPHPTIFCSTYKGRNNAARMCQINFWWIPPLDLYRWVLVLL